MSIGIRRMDSDTKLLNPDLYYVFHYATYGEVSSTCNYNTADEAYAHADRLKELDNLNLWTLGVACNVGDDQIVVPLEQYIACVDHTHKFPGWKQGW